MLMRMNRKQNRLPTSQRQGPLLLLIGSTLAMVAGCDGTDFGPGPADGLDGQQISDRWTIHCRDFRGPQHVQASQQLAGMLKQVEGIDPTDVRLEHKSDHSAIYYGEYVKVRSEAGGELVFSPKFQEDIALLRRLVLNRSTPFRYAMPELIVRGKLNEGDWCITNARGKYTLQIAVFYDTPTLTGRIENANAYVQSLRADNYPAFFWHDPMRSFVFVGEFDAEDVVPTPEGPRFGPEIQRFIDRNADEFSYFTENGFYRKTPGPDGKMVPTPSMLVEIPRDLDESSPYAWDQP
jgi:hypothetical protein